MKIYLTFGTSDYLKTFIETHPSEKLMLLGNDETSVLIHETEGNTIFNEPLSYEIIDGSGEIGIGSFAVFNNVPVSDESRAVFEDRFKKRAGLVEQEKGFCSIRVLRPLASDTFVILTLWELEKDFTAWQQSQAYGTAHAKRGTADGIDKKPSIFPRPSFVTKYTAL